jgi:hypothetical protein
MKAASLCLPVVTVGLAANGLSGRGLGRDLSVVVVVVVLVSGGGGGHTGLSRSLAVPKAVSDSRP